MKTSLRLALNAFLFIFILILPSLSSAQPLFGNYDDDLYQWNQPQLAYKRKAKPVSRSPLYNRKSIGELVGRMSGRRLVDDSYYNSVGKRQYPIRPAIVTFDALRGEQARLNQDKYRDRVKQNARFFLKNGRR